MTTGMNPANGQKQESVDGSTTPIWIILAVIGTKQKAGSRHKPEPSASPVRFSVDDATCAKKAGGGAVNENPRTSSCQVTKIIMIMIKIIVFFILDTLD